MGKVAKDKLRIFWSERERDIYCDFPVGIGTKRDAHYLLGGVFTKEFADELERRGYDLSTLKFEIRVNKKSNIYKTKFPSLAGAEYPDKGFDSNGNLV